MKKMNLKGPLFLLMAAFFWGTTFVAQDLASNAVGPFTFNGARMLLGSLFLLPVLLIKNKGRLYPSDYNAARRRKTISVALFCGVILLFAANLQQLGITMGTGAGKSGFITAMYVVMVPVLGLFFGKRVRPLIWGCVLSAAVGLYFLCMASFADGISGVLSHLSMSRADLVTLVCAVFFTLHIVVLDHKASDLDGVLLSFLQFLIAGAIALVIALIAERPALSDLLAGSGGILYSAFFSCAIAYTLQILGQQTTPAAVASIMMCMESVFAVISDVVVLRTALSLEEIIGCVLMFCAILFSSLSDVLPRKKRT